MSMDYRVGGNLDGITVGAGNLIVHPESLDRPHDSCVLWLRMNEGSGATASDFSGYGNHGTLGAGDAAPTLVAGKYGNALNFDGDDYVTIPNIAGIYDDDFTINCWIYPMVGCFGHDRIVSLSNGVTNEGAQFNYMDGQLSYRVDWGVTDINGATNDDIVAENIWQMATLVVKDEVATLYLNAILHNTPNAGPTSGPITSSYIGWGLTLYYFTGSIDEVRVYNRALTAAEVSKLYLDER